MNKKVSVIIRAKNEEDWIGVCIKNIQSQEYDNYEIIVVDNNSTDGTLLHCKNLGVDKIINIESYKPGAAINTGAKVSDGEFIVILSAHCIPVNKSWLANLISPFDNKDISAVYGRQLPLSYTSPDDTRDLLVTFGCESKVQDKDYTFHNANSAIRKSVWEKHPFSDEATNVEDWIWAHQIVKNGMKIYYSSTSKVWHYHGLNQHGANRSFRSDNVSKILLDVSGISQHTPECLSVESMQGVLVFPYRKEVHADEKDLIRSIKQVREYSDIPICIYSDNKNTIKNEDGVFILNASVDKDAPLIDLLHDALVSYEQNKNIVLDYVYFADFMSQNYLPIPNSVEKLTHELFDNLYSIVSFGYLDTHSSVSCSRHNRDGIMNESKHSENKYNLVFKCGSVFRASLIRGKNLGGARCKIIEFNKSIY
jgi:rhamnosyltransferase